MRRNHGKQIHGDPVEQWQHYRSVYRSKVKLFDEGVGRVITALKAAGHWKDTVIVLSSDHGDMDTHHQLIYKGPFMYDQIIRVPTFLRVPVELGGVEPYVEKNHFWVNVDIVPTVLGLAGVAHPPTHGISAVPLLTGVGEQQEREFVVGQYFGRQSWVNPIRTLRTHQFKYNIYIEHGEELYDLLADPGELVNLADDPEYAAIKKRLRGQLDDWIRAHEDHFYELKVVPLPNR
jgi:arylsulfatase A-like enzyme